MSTWLFQINQKLSRILRAILEFGRTETKLLVAEDGLFIVVWNGVLLEGEWPDAILLTRADAEAFVARSPGRKESYEIEQWTLEALSASSIYAQYIVQIRDQLARDDHTPIMLRPEEWRTHRGN